MPCEKFANSCILFSLVMQEEIVDETDEFIDVANRYVTMSYFLA